MLNSHIDAALILAAIVDTHDRIANDPTYSADRGPAEDKARAESLAAALENYRDTIRIP